MNAEDKEEYRRHYQAEKAEGEPFFPYSVVKDTLVAMLVFLVLIGLVVAFGVPLESQADPTNTAYVPRPEWYFLFLFELLKYFPGELEFVGVIGIPTIGVLALLFLPLLDRSPLRHPVHRPRTIIVTALALVAVAVLTARAIQSTPAATGGPSRTLTAAEQAGKRLYQAQNCAACHSLSGVGGTTGPDLAGITKGHTLDEISAYIVNPKAANPASIMPAYGEKLSADEIRQIAQFLATTGQ
ncbi:MAG: c-type cytochrome [Bacteroidetes bacterium]|nr:c-type cytochrome [Bacteroidota bacterium]MCL5026515.1 c-type cytochrome [Chloroflexota bacterium]